jgi:hypothetical protein
MDYFLTKMEHFPGILSHFMDYLIIIEINHTPQFPPACDQDADQANKVSQIIHPITILYKKLELRERVALLAEGDPKRRMILKAWYNGYNDSETGEMLAHLFGGKSESHRMFARRFRTAE